MSYSNNVVPITSGKLYSHLMQTIRSTSGGIRPYNHHHTTFSHQAQWLLKATSNYGISIVTIECPPMHITIDVVFTTPTKTPISKKLENLFSCPPFFYMIPKVAMISLSDFVNISHPHAVL
jgi:hypothetical protein